jgi:limonene-1,2-epoxide hydrolase
MPAVIGADATIEELAGQFARFADSYEYETVNVVADGELVMNERIDYVCVPDGTRHGLPVMGTFVVRDTASFAGPTGTTL